MKSKKSEQVNEKPQVQMDESLRMQLEQQLLEAQKNYEIVRALRDKHAKEERRFKALADEQRTIWRNHEANVKLYYNTIYSLKRRLGIED